MTSDNPRGQPASSAFLGWLLIAVGGLMALLCGGCTLFVAIGGLFSAGNSPAAAVLLSVVLVAVVGGLPTLAGAALVWAGWRIARPRKPKPDAETFN